ncbi:hypothetical protein [Parablautia sp. Marseille-Q6255]|uniref:hypothetical protein n=1 Tax=Parablautia sp. Marseille-Q6255 TaxID=3039593 RepID=UPI0024BC901A|nr:hypothetical protein [Parablautia sp. Marseille-Q6255]
MEECNKNMDFGNREPDVEKFVVYYDNGEQRVIDKGFFCEMKEEEGACVLSFIMSHVSGRELEHIVFGCVELGVKLGMFGEKEGNESE